MYSREFAMKVYESEIVTQKAKILSFTVFVDAFFDRNFKTELQESIKYAT